MFNRCMSLLGKYGKKGILGTTLIAPSIFLASNCLADIQESHPPHYHWEFYEWNKSFDTAALRRGYQVYKEVCSSCHGMRYLCYRHLVGVIFTNKEAKKEAATAMIEDGPDDEGEMFLRPGTINDGVPSPYKNDNAARAANNGSLPPDLSLIAEARRGGVNYLFSLLTSYSEEIPPGATLEPGQSYNPFFPGGAISMPPPLQDGAVEFPDGTPATVTQMAADVSQFLVWSEARQMERSKQVGMFMVMYGVTGFLFFLWGKRHMMAPIQAQKITYKQRSYAFK